VTRPLSTEPDEDIAIINRRALFSQLIADGDMLLKNLALLKVAEPGDNKFSSVCNSACNFGSDSLLMQFGIRLALPLGGPTPCSKRFAAPIWYRPSSLCKVRSLKQTKPLLPSDGLMALVFVPRAALSRAAFTVITGAA
jgi:hypothetical protein